MQNIHVTGKRWFERVNGNTYHSVDVWIDGEHVYRCPFTYGYGSQYIWTATQGLRDKGLLPGLEYNESTGNVQPLWDYCRKRDIKLVDTVMDVRRKKDL